MAFFLSSLFRVILNDILRRPRFGILHTQTELLRLIPNESDGGGFDFEEGGESGNLIDFEVHGVKEIRDTVFGDLSVLGEIEFFKDLLHCFEVVHRHFIFLADFHMFVFRTLFGCKLYLFSLFSQTQSDASFREFSLTVKVCGHDFSLEGFLSTELLQFFDHVAWIDLEEFHFFFLHRRESNRGYSNG